ncbi:acetylornithine aminotransferase/putrescine aminotransferase [Xenorhabdus cabanillasii]|uniref:Acetylornithine aminotransferase/putrescine aminotransferase n=1 Tax=Xenorhabdus cabanillasii TaxID=351673 RepID=A0A3D9UGW3_9GAMM|nr:aminotransferase class III-fold pyridoxal phosphate-dependent enzyme [Xenorhabdus cabanillasii]REF28599.1 acetylornithine aminotransferase/putrescine aminotransferase [Xenorhabdus cabanillasii]
MIKTEQYSVQSASGANVVLENGQTLFDLATGGIGYSIKEIAERVKDKAMKMGLSNRVLMSEPLLKFCHSLSLLLPTNLSNTYVCSSGDEAFEGALKLCKALNPSSTVIAYVSGCQFGSLFFGRCLSNRAEFDSTKGFFNLNLLEIDRNNPLSFLDQGVDCLAICYSPLFLDETGELKPLSTKQLIALKDISRQLKVPLICNVNEFCMGVTGQLFGFDESIIVPDIVVLGGPIGGNLVPLGCYITSLDNANLIYGTSSPAKHGSTTGGNPLASIAGLSTLDYVQDKQAHKHFSKLGNQIAEYLQPYVASVTGSIVNVRIPHHVESLTLVEKLKQKGVLVKKPNGNILTLYPMLNSDPLDLKSALSIIKGMFDDNENI